MKPLSLNLGFGKAQTAKFNVAKAFKKYLDPAVLKLNIRGSATCDQVADYTCRIYVESLIGDYFDPSKPELIIEEPMYCRDVEAMLIRFIEVLDNE